MGYQYRVVADIEYLDGWLAGMVLPAGYSVPMPDVQHAMKTANWLERVRQAGDFIRATGTGNRYRVVGGISYHAI